MQMVLAIAMTHQIVPTSLFPSPHGTRIQRVPMVNISHDAAAHIGARSTHPGLPVTHLMGRVTHQGDLMSHLVGGQGRLAGHRARDPVVIQHGDPKLHAILLTQD